MIPQLLIAPKLREPLPSLVGNLPNAVLRLLHPAILIDHRVPLPLGGIPPADGFPVRLEDIVVERF